jgi:AMP deaminase
VKNGRCFDTLLRFFSDVFYCIVVYCNELHYITLCYILLYDIGLYYIILYRIVFDYIALLLFAGQSRLREIFLKTENHIGGRYLAEMTKEVQLQLRLYCPLYV